MATDLEAGQPQRATKMQPPVRNKSARKLIAMSNRELKEHVSRRLPRSRKQGTRGKGKQNRTEEREEKKGLLKRFLIS